MHHQNVIYIDRQEDLQRLCQQLKQEPLMAVDTESDSFHRYREKVCLIQISIPKLDLLIDPLRLENLDPLKEIFANPQQIKIFHDACYDLICLLRDHQLHVQGIFDTMLASRLLGSKLCGLATLLQEHFSYKMDKRYQKSDWSRRPLSQGQLLYARMDTHFLCELREKLLGDLQQQQRLQWAEEDFQRLPGICRKLLEQSHHKQQKQQGFWQLTGIHNLDNSAKGRLKALWLWREQKAKEADKPAFKICEHHFLLELTSVPATQLKKRFYELGLHQKLKSLEPFLQTIQHAESLEGPPPSGMKRRKGPAFSDPLAKKRYEKLRRLRKSLAETVKVEPDVLLSNALLSNLAKNPPQHKEELQHHEDLQGWRGQQFAEAIFEVIRA